jgi:hypothetical protein
MGAAQQGAVGGAGEQEPACEQAGQSDQERPGAAEQLRQPSAEQLADEPAVIGAERHHQGGECEDEPGAKRPHLEQRTAEEHQPADDGQSERSDVRGRAEDVAEAGLELLAHHPAFPPEIEQRGEEEAERSEAEPDQLGVLVRGARVLLLRRPLLDARGRARP